MNTATKKNAKNKDNYNIKKSFIIKILKLRKPYPE